MNTGDLTRFLHLLSINNEKEWFDRHRDWYETLRNEFKLLVTDIIFLLTELDPALGTQSPREALFRINRDIRFSKDKTPYKTTFSAAFSNGGKTSNQPKYYFHIDEKGKLMVAGGIYHPDNQVLDKIRKDIASDSSKIYSILNNPDFKQVFGDLKGDALKRPPRGFNPAHPDIELLKLKSFAAFYEVPIATIDSGQLAQYIVSMCKTVNPLVEYLRQTINTPNS